MASHNRFHPLPVHSWLRNFAAAVLSCGVLTAATLAAGSEPKADPPQSDEALLNASRLGANDVGYFVIDLSSQRVLAERNANRPFIPASVAKIATIASALEVLGADHRFTTTVEAAGDVVDGVLKGSLVLVGGGDPSLTGDDLQALAKDLAATGIRSVDGQFLYDASATVEMSQINTAQPEAVDYNCGISALSVNYNRVRLNWQKVGSDRTPTVVSASRKLTVPLTHVSVAFAGGDLAGPFVRFGPPTGDRWLLSANLPDHGEDWLPVGNPSLVTAEAFRGAAAAAGITLPEPAPGVAPPGARELARHDSAPLTEIAREVIRYSNNMAAELIGLATSRALTGDKLSLDNSAASVVDWWQKRLPKADWTGLSLANHSGLSTKSRATPRQIVTMLEEAAEQHDGDFFHDLLHPVVWKGTKGKGFVKTGTMSYVRGLAGYIDTAAGHRLAFAVFFNDEAKRAALEAAFDPHVRAIDALSRSWRNRAVTLEQKLVAGWANRF